MEITANALQTVAVGQSVLFTDTPICGNCSIVHRDGSGLITLRGITKQCRARFKVTFGANIAVPTGVTVGPISLAITLDGETIPGTTMIETPTVVGAFNNVSRSVYIDVPAGCCETLSVKNVGAISVNVQNANLIVDRVA